MPLTYILKSLKDNRTYTGHTTQKFEQRLKNHNDGKVQATRRRRPFQVLIIEEHATLGAAKKREKYWKSDAGRRKLKRLLL